MDVLRASSLPKVTNLASGVGKRSVLLQTSACVRSKILHPIREDYICRILFLAGLPHCMGG